LKNPVLAGVRGLAPNLHIKILTEARKEDTTSFAARKGEEKNAQVTVEATGGKDTRGKYHSVLPVY